MLLRSKVENFLIFNSGISDLALSRMNYIQWVIAIAIVVIPIPKPIVWLFKGRYFSIPFDLFSEIFPSSSHI